MKKLILTLVLGVFFVAFSSAQSSASTKKAVKNETYTVQETKKKAVSTSQSCTGKVKAACKGKEKVACKGKAKAKACCPSKKGAKECNEKATSKAACKGKAKKSCGSGKS